jgi:hypothetical protein
MTLLMAIAGFIFGATALTISICLPVSRLKLCERRSMPIIMQGRVPLG